MAYIRTASLRATPMGSGAATWRVLLQRLKAPLRLNRDDVPAVEDKSLRLGLIVHPILHVNWGMPFRNRHLIQFVLPLLACIEVLRGVQPLIEERAFGLLHFFRNDATEKVPDLEVV